MDTRVDSGIPPTEPVTATLWPATGPEGPERISKDWLLHLSQRLQSTLDPVELVTIFSTEAAAVVPFDNAAYRNEPRTLATRHGEPERHRCTYTLVVGAEELGMMSFTRSTPFTEHDTVRLEFLTSHLVLPLRNALLYQDALAAASKDPLTQIHNRAAFDDLLAQEISLSVRHGSSLSLVMLDLDHFKAVNDSYGHVVGDQVLKAFVRRVGQCTRGSDMVFRYGGEEFALVLRSTELAGALALAERIRESVERMRVENGTSAVRLTVSLGVTQLRLGDDPLSLVERSDRALYRSKRAGRNRVSSAR